MQDFLGNMEDRREASFLKAKNFINQRRQAQDDSASRNEAKIKANSRYESAEKSYFSKLRSESNVSNFIPFPDTLPLSLNLISSQYHTAEPDYGKGPQTGRASQAESISSREDGNRRPSFIKVSKKLWWLWCFGKCFISIIKREPLRLRVHSWDTYQWFEVWKSYFRA